MAHKTLQCHLPGFIPCDQFLTLRRELLSTKDGPRWNYTGILETDTQTRIELVDRGSSPIRFLEILIGRYCGNLNVRWESWESSWDGPKTSKLWHLYRNEMQAQERS